MDENRQFSTEEIARIFNVPVEALAGVEREESSLARSACYRDEIRRLFGIGERGEVYFDERNTEFRRSREAPTSVSHLTQFDNGAKF